MYYVLKWEYGIGYSVVDFYEHEENARIKAFEEGILLHRGAKDRGAWFTYKYFHSDRDATYWCLYKNTRPGSLREVM